MCLALSSFSNSTVVAVGTEKKRIVKKREKYEWMVEMKIG
jgi:hypothetical protein